MDKPGGPASEQVLKTQQEERGKSRGQSGVGVGGPTK